MSTLTDGVRVLCKAGGSQKAELAGNRGWAPASPRLPEPPAQWAAVAGPQEEMWGLGVGNNVPALRPRVQAPGALAGNAPGVSSPSES